jgi:hypothetical protein
MIDDVFSYLIIRLSILTNEQQIKYYYSNIISTESDRNLELHKDNTIDN